MVNLDNVMNQLPGHQEIRANATQWSGQEGGQNQL